ncbi:MAG: AmmeMemoRadiSam system protein A, partial [Candidatus Omnitrophota bacterium]
DEAFSSQLTGKKANITFDKQAFEGEHSLEVQLPFLQSALNDFLIVPVVTGDVTLDDCKEFAKLLKSAIGLREDVLIVASTDMYHGYSIKDAEKTDGLTLETLKKMDAQALYYGLREGSLQLCGGFGVVSAIILSKELGYINLEVLSHTNSALVTGNKDGSWVVGYAASVLYRKEDKSMLNSLEKKRLLEIARSTIENYLRIGKVPEVKVSEPNLLKPGGAFVTLNEDGQLRGCIGNMSAKTPLFITVRDMAIQAATEDPRFAPLKAQELNKVKIEVSVLSPLEKVGSADAIKLGTHGVLVRRGFNSGVFLPQVATETGWSKEEFLSNLCAHKAGLEADAWKDKSTEIYVFSAQVFSE